MEIIAAFAVGLIALCLIGKLVALPMKLLWKMITNSIVGALVLWVVNIFGAGVEITFLKALIAGVLGVPGVIIVLLMK
ncbi:pro-sigmaK processing inhibitor BofA family protein [Selenomonas ruminantium]|uniref:Inhibitor of the pro-sigma K processing machinery n=1 Tax=Selenomonas ruminantium TaxID=971 RepID=A0A1H0QUG3_SELRU|nr:pro-sigmaK processing inhibitor BofA family protein [Selenomonas ruminantium]SDP20439.1 inhibitor of the pro-sigma K processing machinery [Selenomonas ruminantium]